MGDRYIRRLLIGGMTSRVRTARSKPEKADPWLLALLERKPARVATVAMANKTAPHHLGHADQRGELPTDNCIDPR